MKKITVFSLVILFAFAIVLFLWGRQVNSDIKWLREYGVPANGTITAVYPVFRTQVNYAVEYVTVEGQTEIAPLSYAEEVRLGDRVELLYSPYDHQFVMLANTQENYVVYVVPTILFLMGLLGIFIKARG